MDTRPIGIFDSGVGGLSILREIRKLLPRENYIFIADQKNIPYGGKTRSQLCLLTERITRFLIKMGAKIIVIACNTATCYTIEFLRRKFPSNIFVGTVPAIKPAARLSLNKTIVVLSTPATARSFYLKNLIRDNAAGIKVVNIGCPNLENLVEEGRVNSPEIKILVTKYLKKAASFRPDYIVLGCTHFPFLKEVIRGSSPFRANTIDSGRAIARRVKNLLNAVSLENGRKTSTIYYTTGNPKRFSKVASRLLRAKIKAKRLKI